MTLWANDDDGVSLPTVLEEFSQSKSMLRIARASLEAVDPGRIIRKGVSLVRGELCVGGRRIDLNTVSRVEVLAVGKAAGPMVAALVEILGPRIAGGLAIVKRGGWDHSLDVGNIDILEAAHPVPDLSSVAAAEEFVRRAEALGESDLAIVLIGGGASALLTLPAPEIDLRSLQQTTDLLLRSGATIHQLNTVRKHLSSIKGGRLAGSIAPAKTLGLVLSDVVGDALDAIGSGPISPDPTSFRGAWEILNKYDLLSQIPLSVRDYLQRGRDGAISENPGPEDPVFKNVETIVLGSNRHACLGALAQAQKEGFCARIVTSTLEGEAREVGGSVAVSVDGIREENRPVGTPACLVFGGETTVTVRGTGKGGRNQELALAAALAIEGMSGVAVVTLATDGGDGPTDAAGAVVSGNTVKRALALGLDPQQYLDNNNAYPFFDALGDLIRTGPTMTNVADLLVIFVF